MELFVYSYDTSPNKNYRDDWKNKILQWLKKNSTNWVNVNIVSIINKIVIILPLIYGFHAFVIEK